MSEGPGSCTKSIYEECKLHPVDCPTCKNTDVCQMKADVWPNRHKIKRCQFYEKRSWGEKHNGK